MKTTNLQRKDRRNERQKIIIIHNILQKKWNKEVE